MNTLWPLPAAALAPTKTPSGRSVSRFLFKWKWTILGVAIVILAAAAGLLYALPQSFVAQATVLVERNRAPVMRAELSPGLEMAEVMNTAQAIANSRTVMERVVDRLRLVDEPTSDGWLARLLNAATDHLVSLGLWPEVEPREAWINRLFRWAEIKPTVNSNILTITLTTESPELSARIANAISSEYITHYIRIYSTKGLADFYQQQMDTAESEYRTLRNQLLDFKEKNALAASDATRAELVKELSSLRNQVMTSNNELVRLLKRYDAQHAEVQLIRGAIAAAEARIEETEAQLRVIERNEAIVADLEMLLDAQRKTFLDYTHKFREANISERADQDVVNVRLVEHAVAPARPRFSRLFLLAIALVAAVLLGIAVAFLREYLDQRAATPDVVERALGVPVVGWLERLPRRRLRRLFDQSADQRKGV